MERRQVTASLCLQQWVCDDVAQRICYALCLQHQLDQIQILITVKRITPTIEIRLTWEHWNIALYGRVPCLYAEIFRWVELVFVDTYPRPTVIEGMGSGEILIIVQSRNRAALAQTLFDAMSGRVGHLLLDTNVGHFPERW